MNSFPVPNVLEAMKLVLRSPGGVRSQRIVRDYEFDLYLGGERDIYIDDVHYHISEGNLVFRKPGQTIAGYGDYNMYMLTLDFSNRDESLLKNYFRSSSTPQQATCNLDILKDIPAVFVPYHQNELKELFKNLSQCSPPNLVDKELQKQYIMELLFLIFADVYKYQRQKKEDNIDGNSYVKKACIYINAHYNEPLRVEHIAQELSLNQNYLIKLFGRELNVTPNQYIMETRLLRSRYMLIQTEYSIQQIAELCGFNTSSYFIKCFKGRFKKSPLVYRNEHKSKGEY